MGAAGLCCLHTGGSGCSTSAAAFEWGDGVRLIGVADARIDNRPEIVRALAHLGASEADADVELMLKAFAAWRMAAFGRLVGAFAIIIWDDVHRQFVCARDPIGLKVIYTRVDAHGVSAATQIAQLLNGLEQRPALDLDYVADLLAGGITRANATTTPYAGIERLRPGHALIVDRGEVRDVQYWDWETSPAVRYPSAEDYALHFRALFTDAVRANLRTSGAVWADLSGGLDSSSIVSVACETLSGVAPISAVSLVFPEASVSDERPWSAHVRQKYGLAEHAIDGDRHCPLRGLDDLAAWWDEPHPGLLFGDIHRSYHDLFAINGGTTLLTGVAAEAVVLGKDEGPVHMADLLARLAWGRLARELRAWQTTLRKPYSNLLLRYAIRPWAGPRLIGYGWQRTVHDWIRPDFDRRFDLRARAQHGSMPPAFASPADQLHYEKIGRVEGFLLRGYLDKCTDVRYPFLHRPLMEFMLRVPWDVKLRASESKTLLRNAMRDVLPEPIRTRRMTSSFGHAVYRGIQQEWRTVDALIRDSRLAALGCISPDRLRHAAQLARCGHADDLHGLLSTLAIEAWLQGGFERSPTAARPHAVAAGEQEFTTHAVYAAAGTKG